MSTMRDRHRRSAPVAATVAATLSLSLLAAAGPTQIVDPCGGGALPRTDICLVTVTPAFVDGEQRSDGSVEQILDTVHLTAEMDADIEEWRPNEIREVNFELDGCLWGIKWFHDPGADLPGEMTTRLDRRCDGDFAGVELAAPTIQGATISTTITPDDVAALGAEIRTGTVLERVRASTYVGAGTQALAYTQGSYETDQTDAVTITLE